MTTTTKATTEFPVLATIPVLNWKIVNTLQGPCFEFPDGRHDWPTPRERQIIEAFIAGKATTETDALIIAAKDTLDAVFNDGRQPDGWVQVQVKALDELRAATEQLEGKGQTQPEQATEFDQVFEELEAPDYPATCDECGVEGTNQTMAEHVCDTEITLTCAQCGAQESIPVTAYEK